MKLNGLHLAGAVVAGMVLYHLLDLVVEQRGEYEFMTSGHPLLVYLYSRKTGECYIGKVSTDKAVPMEWVQKVDAPYLPGSILYDPPPAKKVSKYADLLEAE